MIYDIPVIQLIVGTIFTFNVFIVIGLNMTKFADYEEVEEIDVSHSIKAESKCTVYWNNKKVS